MDNDKIPEEILREWIEKARPLVDSAWNLALDEAIRVVNEMVLADKEYIISHLTKLKKNTNGN